MLNPVNHSSDIKTSTSEHKDAIVSAIESFTDPETDLAQHVFDRVTSTDKSSR